MRFAGKKYKDEHQAVFRQLSGVEMELREGDKFTPIAMTEVMKAFHLDPRIVAAIEQSGPVALATLQTVLNEWPHVSEGKGRAWVAYLRDPAHLVPGDMNTSRFTTCKPGAYLARVFPELPGRAVELIVTMETPAEFALVNTSDAIVQTCRAVGSGSCMGGDKFSGGPRHPFRAYDPELGWSMAVRYEDGQPVGRALVCEIKGKKVWVRSYTKSGSDHALERWMRDQGITRADDWRGARLKRIECGDDLIVAPYLDGDVRHVEDDGEVLMVSSHGELGFDQTCGYVEADNHAGQVETANGDWIGEEDAITVDGEVYHVDDCTRLSNGDWVRDRDAVYCPYSDTTELLEDCQEITVGPHRGEMAVGGDTVELFDGEIALAEYCVQLQAGVHEDEWALEEDTVKDWDGEVHIREDCVLLTKGVHKGEWIAEDSDELIVLEYGDYCHTEDAAWVEGNRWCGGRHEEMSRRKTKVPFGKALAFDLAFRAAKEVAHAHC